MNSVTGRIKYWFGVADPLKSLVTNKQVLDYNDELKTLAKEANGTPQTYTRTQYNDLLYKKRVQLSSIHPDTGELVPWYARTSAFVTTNVPIIAAMSLSAPTPFNTIFWQWFNQTYNACFNYGNRNASSTTTNAQMLTSYTLAVTSAIGAAMGIRKGFAKVFGTGQTGAVAAVITSIVNYFAICLSSGANVACMRAPEMKNGVSVMDPETMEVVGTSKVAAKKGVMMSVQGRWVYCIPIFFTQPLLLAMFGRFLPKAGPVRFIADLSFFGIGLWIAMPVCCGLYPQYSKIMANELEEDVRAKLRADQQYLLFNKGV